MLGGLAGIYMYSVIPPKSFFTYMVFVNSLFQALSLYALAVYFDGWDRLIKSFNYFTNDTTPTKNDKEEDDV